MSRMVSKCAISSKYSDSRLALGGSTLSQHDAGAPEG